MRESQIKNPQDLAQYIDHTLLRADATLQDIKTLCEEAARHSFKAVCVNPIFVAATRGFLNGTPVMTAAVIGFPLGASLASTKSVETASAIRDGAREIDMVLRLDLAKAGDWGGVEDDIRTVVTAADKHVVKVILETGLLDEDQIARACQAAESAGAQFVKTATGFLGRGASLEDIMLMKKSCSLKMEIKASGGVKTFEQAKALIDAGATRLGTSSGVALVTGLSATAGTTY